MVTKGSDIDSISTGNISTSGLTDDFVSTGNNYLTSDDTKGRIDRAPSPSRYHSSDVDRLKPETDAPRTADSLSTSEEVVDAGKPVPEKRISSSAVKTLISHLLSGASSVQLVQVR